MALPASVYLANNDFVLASLKWGPFHFFLLAIQIWWKICITVYESLTSTSLQTVGMSWKCSSSLSCVKFCCDNFIGVCMTENKISITLELVCHLKNQNQHRKWHMWSWYMFKMYFIQQCISLRRKWYWGKLSYVMVIRFHPYSHISWDLGSAWGRYSDSTSSKHHTTKLSIHIGFRKHFFFKVWS